MYNSCSQRVWPTIANLPHRLQHVIAAGIRTRVFIAGPEDGAAIVLVPPLFLTLDTFLYAIPGLAQKYLVIAYDKPGRGFSDIASAPQSVAFLADHLLSLIEKLGIDGLPLFLSGSGFGGWVAARAVSKGGVKSIRGLILNNPGNPRPHVVDALRAANLQEIEEGTLEAARKGLRRLVSSERYVLEDLACIRYVTHLLSGEKPAVAKENVEFCLAAFGNKEDSWEESWVEKIVMPTLVIWSTQNKIDHISDYDSFISRLPKASLKIIDGGMLPQIEQPELFVSLHQDFIEEVRKDGR